MEKTEIDWLKLFVNFLDGDSFKHMRRAKVEGVMDPRDKLEAVWWELLALAGKCNHGGAIWNDDGVSYKTDEDIAIAVDRAESEIQFCMAFYVKQGMITRTDKGPIINNFDKYQSIDKLTQIREAARLRQEKHRVALKRLSMSRDGDVTSQNPSQETKDVAEDVKTSEVLPSFTRLDPNRGFGPYVAYLYEHSYLNDFDLSDEEVANQYKEFLGSMDAKYGNRNLHLTLKYFVGEYCKPIYRGGRIVGWSMSEDPQSKIGLLKKSVSENCERFSGKSEDELPFGQIGDETDDNEWKELMASFCLKPEGGD